MHFYTEKHNVHISPIRLDMLYYIRIHINFIYTYIILHTLIAVSYTHYVNINNCLINITCFSLIQYSKCIPRKIDEKDIWRDRANLNIRVYIMVVAS